MTSYDQFEGPMRKFLFLVKVMVKVFERPIKTVFDAGAPLYAEQNITTLLTG